MDNLNIYLECKSPLHVGQGIDIGIVDRPIQREVVTGFPKIEASTLKGCLRRELEKISPEYINPWFGKEGDAGSLSKAGTISLVDAKILFFPVNNIKGIYSLITCSYVMKRYLSETQDNNGDIYRLLIKDIDDNNRFINNDMQCYTSSTGRFIKKDGDLLVLDDYILKRKDLKLTISEDALKSFIEKIVVVSDDMFTDLVKSKTEVITRIRIHDKESKNVDKALFTEEYVPEGTVFYTQAILFDNIKNKKLDDLIKFNESINEVKILQIGGNRSLGKGMVSISGGD